MDLANEHLCRGTEVIRLRPKTFAVLRYLTAHAGQLVTKDELLTMIWPETVVSEAALTVCIGELRQALGDNAKPPTFIETVHRRGYRFKARLTMAMPSEAAAERDGDSRPFTHSHGMSLVGRDTELNCLNRCLTAALQGERQMVFITGEAGIGKTTLIEAFVERVAADADVWLGRGQCVDQYGVGEAYLPLLEALGRLCRSSGDRFRPLLYQYALSWLLQMPALLSAEELASLPTRVHEATQARMLRELAEALDVITAERPLILVLEDLHWSDDSTLAWLAYVARRRGSARLLIVQELLQHKQAEELQLAYLTEAAVETYLVSRFIRHRFPGHFAQAMHQRTNGNPLFMVTVVDALIQQGILDERAEGWTLQGALEDVAASVPENLRQLIEQQLLQVSPADQAVLEAASVVGAAFSVAAVAAGIQQEEVDVETRCEALARRGQFIRSQDTEVWPDGTIAARYGFIHTLYQEVLYHRVSSGQRIRLHQRIGQRKEVAYGERANEIATELAVHFRGGRDARRASRYWRHAGDNMLQRHAHHEAIACYDNALDMLQQLPASRDRDEQVFEMYFAIYRACVPIAAYDRIMAVLREAERLAEDLADQDRLGQLCSRLSYACRVMGDYHQAAAYARRGIAIGKALGNDMIQVYSTYRLGQAYQTLGDYQRASTCFRDIVDGHTGVVSQDNLYGFPSVFARAQLSLCLAERVKFDEGLARGMEAVRIAETVDSPFARIVSYGGLGGLYLRQGAVTDAIRILERALDLCRLWDMLDWFPTIATFLGTGHALAGNIDEAWRRLEQAMEQRQALGNQTDQAFVLIALGEVYLRAGRVTEALDQAREAHDVAHVNQERGTQAWSLWLLGEITSQTQPLVAEPAQTHYQHALGLASELDMRPLQAHCHHGLGELYSRTWQSQQAQAEFACASALYREAKMTFWLRRLEAVINSGGVNPISHNHEGRMSYARCRCGRR